MANGDAGSSKPPRRGPAKGRKRAKIKADEMRPGRFTVSYDGADVRDGQMDAREVASALLAWADLIQDASDVLNDKRAKVHVRVGPQNRRGSHPIDFSVALTLVDTAKTLFGVLPIADP